jgi:hypothetical protein
MKKLLLRLKCELLQNFINIQTEIMFSFNMSMKKILVAILLVTYTFATSGASVDLHYCMGKLIGVDFDYVSKKDCGNCGMPIKDKKGCCNNRQIQSNVDKDQQAVAYNNISLANELFTILPRYTIADDIIINSTIITYHSIHAPPLIQHNPTYLLNRNFRI